MTTDTHPRSLWRQPRFVALLGGQWVSQIGDVAFSLALYWYVLTTTHRPLWLGLLAALAGLGNAMAVVSGVLVDRWDRRTTLLITDAIRGAIIGGLVIWLLHPHHGLLPVFGIAVLLVNLGGSVFNPALMAFTPQVIDADQLMQANGFLQSAAYVAQLAGYACGGVLIALLGVDVLFAIDSVSFWVSALSFVYVRPTVSAPRQTQESRAWGRFWQDLRDGQRLIWRHPFLRRALPTALIVNMALMPLNVLDVVWVRRVLHLGAIAYASFGAAMLIGMIGGSVLAGRIFQRFAVSSVIAGCLATAGGALILFSRLPLLVISWAGLLAIGISFGILNTGLATLIQQATPSALLGRVAGALMTLSGLANPFGAAVAGLATTEWPVALILSVSGGVLAAASTIFLLGVPKTVTPIALDSDASPSHELSTENAAPLSS